MLAFFSNAAARVRRDEKGATAVEYGLMVSLIAVAIVLAVTFLGGQISTMFQSAACGVQGKTYHGAVAAVPPVSGVGGSAAVAASCS
ncbi:pilus assembly protein Flp/PilA [Arthrobacter globiformis]|uniref:Flp family type IVb pilin n=1 Tax=Arthrobacter globiformis TaxID=1665 RepID=UPI00277F3993|nr:Flp family type IVb pilin [Arthrobacter globiformis]MDQ1059594.1 pilus assembly protein Flp/PilA [Arthrobacter globiformis]